MPELLAVIPAGSREYLVLSLCFVDPCDIGIKFKTIRRLSNRYIDFLVVLARYMDANSARPHYLHPKSTKVAEVLDSPDGRGMCTRTESSGIAIPRVMPDAIC